MRKAICADEIESPGCLFRLHKFRLGGRRLLQLRNLGIERGEPLGQLRIVSELIL